MSNNLFGFALEGAWDYENAYHLTSHPTRMAKLLAHYELYRSIVGLPGHVVECGVYKGASLIRFATFRHILESPDSRKIIGFDAFGKFPPQSDADDAAFIERLENDGGDGIPLDELERVFAHKAYTNYEFVRGDICETLPRYLADHPEFRIALLHVDVDVYKPTADILSSLYPRIVPGGVLILDDYGIVSGATRAVDEYFADCDILIEKLALSHRPAFVRKPGSGAASLTRR